MDLIGLFLLGGEIIRQIRIGGQGAIVACRNRDQFYQIDIFLIVGILKGNILNYLDVRQSY